MSDQKKKIETDNNDFNNTTARIRALIAENDLEQAEQELVEALTRWPKRPGLSLMMYRLYGRIGQHEAARSFLMDSLKKFPGNVAINMEVVQLHINNDDLELASKNLQSWLQQKPQNSMVLMQAALLREKAGDLVEAQRHWRDLVSQADSPKDVVFYLNRMLQTSKLSSEFILEVVEDVIKQWKDSVGVNISAATLLITYGEIKEGMLLLRQAQALDPDNHKVQLMLLKCASELGIRIEISDVTGGMQGISSSEVPAYVRSLLDDGDEDSAVKLFEHILSDPNSSAKSRLTIARMLSRRGVVVKGVSDTFHSLLDDPEFGPEAQRQLAATRFMESTASAQLDDSGFVDNPVEEVQCCWADGADTVVLVFTGLAGMACVNLNVLHTLLVPYGASIVYLRDVQRLLYMNGISALGDDYPSTINALKKMLPKGTRRLLCVGSSAGGYASIRYAMDLGADAVLGFGAPTDISEQGAAKDGRVDMLLSRLRKRVPDMMINLRDLLIEQNKPEQISLWYGDEHAQDKMHAINLADLDLVTVNSISGDSHHDIMMSLIIDERIDAVFGEFISGSNRDIALSS